MAPESSLYYIIPSKVPPAWSLYNASWFIMHLYLKHFWPRMQDYGGEELRRSRGVREALSMDTGMLGICLITERFKLCSLRCRFSCPLSRQEFLQQGRHKHCGTALQKQQKLASCCQVAASEETDAVMLPPGGSSDSCPVPLCCTIAKRTSRTWWPRVGVKVSLLLIHVFYCCNCNILIEIIIQIP